MLENTNKRMILVAIGVALLLAFAGCSANQGADGDQLEEDTGEDFEGVSVGESYWFEVKITERNQENLVKRQPPEGMDRSLERQNLKQRYQYLNDQNNQHYVYLLSHGKVVTWFTAQGKVSSVNSKLTNNKQIIRVNDCDSHKSGNDCFKTVESPQMDGSYGTNGDAVFFFTTDGRYVQWNGEYIVSEQPLNVNTPPELTQQVDDDEEASGPTDQDDQPGNETEDSN